MTDITMPVLYQKLASLNSGFTKKYIRAQGLPSWWDEQLDSQPVATLEGAGYISRRLHIDLLSLLKEEKPRFKPLPQTKFKYHRQGETGTPEATPQIASSIAVAVADATKLEFKPVSDAPGQIRAKILEKHPQVKLYSLLDYCWKHGIAVVYFNQYPKKNRKIAGMIQWQGHQPVIVLSGGNTHPACLAFNLAHELGHLALGHIKAGDEILIDSEISADADDPEEIESNRFAMNLLVDDADNQISAKTFKNAEFFKQYLEKFSANHPTVDPAAIAFNYAWYNKKYFPLAKSTVKLLEGEQCGKSTIHNFLENHLNWDELKEDAIDRLEVILGA